MSFSHYDSGEDDVYWHSSENVDDRVEAEEWLFGVDFSKVGEGTISHDHDDQDHGLGINNNDDDDNDGDDDRTRRSQSTRLSQNSELFSHIQNLMNLTRGSRHGHHRSEDSCALDGDVRDDNNEDDDDDDEYLNQLWTLATKEGALLESLRVSNDAYGGRGVLSTRNIQKGDVVAILPRHLRIGQTTACRRLNLPSRTPDLTALSLLMLDLVHSIRTNAESASSRFSSSSPPPQQLSLLKDPLLCCYVACLPRTCQNGLFMTTEQQEYWTKLGLDYESSIHGIQDQGKACVGYIVGQFMEEIKYNQTNLSYLPGLTGQTTTNNTALIWWAISMIQSRAHGFGQGKGRYLTPIFDFCNHSPTPNCQLQGDANGDIILRSLRDVPKGCEITIDYQVADDAKMVACYGFSLKHPPSLLKPDVVF
jgi:SET domain